MSDQYAVVLTTINHPTFAVQEIARRAPELDAKFYLIGDSKSPDDFHQEGSQYLNIQGQKDTGFKFAQLCPTKHYARKNIGYLAAMKAGATIIVETDDDNIPRDGFWAPRERSVSGKLAEAQGWCNVYGYYADALIWPRGLPLDRVQDTLPALSSLRDTVADCPIQQGLADENPDVDAIYRLILPLPVNFNKGGPVILDKGVWCPFNSQNTTFWRDAFPLLYLPFHCSFRMTDIWRSFVAQRLMWESGWKLSFHESTVYQERNEHDLMHDFKDEVPGYLNNERIKKTLEDLALGSGKGAIVDNLVKAYDALITLGVVGAEEAPLVAAWAADLEAIG
ncbi:hypothetical protein BH10PSE4_BH10PSE4_08660 [soil metagenome]